MRYLWKLALTFLLIMPVYEAAEPQETLPFTTAACTEIIHGQPAHATCLVEAQNGHGSGVLVSLNDQTFVLTSGHIPAPHTVHFLILNKETTPPKPESLRCSVIKAIPMENDPKKLTAQTDLQILFINGKHTTHVRPLTLSSEVNPSAPLSAYGIGGILLAEFVKGQLSIATPTRNGNVLPAKVMLPTFIINPKASALNYAQNFWVTFFHKLGLFSFAIPAPINPATGKIEGIIEATTCYNPELLETHIGQGFSGGPALQGNKVVGIFQSGALNLTNRANPETTKLLGYQFLAMWASYCLGIKLPLLQTISPWLVDPIIAPTLRFGLEKFGCRWLSSPLRMCAFSTLELVLSTLAGKAYAAYTTSPNALKKPQKTLFVHITPAVINWIDSVLATQPTASQNP